MALKKHHPGCSAGVDCACDSDCTLQFEDFTGDELPATLVEAAGAWSIDDDELTTADADAIVRTAGAHSSAAMSAEADLRGATAGDTLRVLVAYTDAGEHLAGEIELGTCEEPGTLRLLQDGAEVATLTVPDLVADVWHTLRVCYAPAAGGSGSGGDDAPTLSAALTAGGQVALGDQVPVTRTLQAEVTAATGLRAGLATGGTLGEQARFDNFAWYDNGDDCPNCAGTPCLEFSDYFHRTPRDQDDPGCAYDVDAGASAPVSEVSEFVSYCTLSGGGMVCRAAASSHVMRARLDVADLTDGGSVRLDICRADGSNYLFARVARSGSTLALAIGEAVGGGENLVDTSASLGASGDFVLQVCYDGTLLMANVVTATGTDTARAQGGVTDTTATGSAVTAESGTATLESFALAKRDTDAGCGWCTVACDQCEEQELPGSVLLALDFDCGSTVVELPWSPSSFYNPTCGEFVDGIELPAGCLPLGITQATARAVYRRGEVFLDLTTVIGTATWRKAFSDLPTCLADHALEFYGADNTVMGPALTGDVTIGPA